ncbi:MAG: glycosyltransferase [Betaproteobacteria bacterium]|nr:MAG: glycosyltransferase [Betaproteobacteria bacterium]
MIEAITAPASRNDPCPCGSGKRYKHCHGETVAPKTATDVDALARRGLDAHQAGQLELAAQIYRQVLDIKPDHDDCLHMLGVVCLTQLRFVEARDLIERAGRLVSWQPPNFRHNFGYVLSAFLSGREAPISAVHTRDTRLREGVPTVGFIVLASDETSARSLDETLSSLSLLGEPARRCVIATTSDAPAFIDHVASIPTVRGIESHIYSSLQEALALVGTDFVVFLTPGDTVTSSMNAAVAAGWRDARSWVIARSEPGEFSTNDVPVEVRINAFRQLHSSKRAGAALLEDFFAVDALCNVAFKRDFLAALIANKPASAYELLLDATWSEEPLVYDAMVSKHAWPKSVTHPFLDFANGSLDLFIERALTTQPPNPLAPHFNADRGAFLKTPLRTGLGSRLSGKTLERIAALIDMPRLGVPTLSLSDTTGIDLVGFARAEIGLGESMRLLAQSCHAAQVPFTVTDIPLDSGVRQADYSLDPWLSNTAKFRARLICTNPDQLAVANLVDGVGALRETYNIGYWYWELPNLPADWVRHQELIDELWVATEFVAACARKSLSIPVRTLMPPVVAPVLTREYTRAEFGLPDDVFVFMFSFDYGSFPTRKNPEAVISAFRKAFSKSEHDVRLLIKFQRAHTFRERHLETLNLIGDDSRILAIEQTLSRTDLCGLQSVIDAYVSLHRSEGLGLGLAECMAIGKPVIATAYSGNLEFMNAGNSMLVDYSLIDLKEGDYVAWQNQQWAEPDIGHAAEQMRRLYADREFAHHLGQRAKRDIATKHSPIVVGAKLQAELGRIYSRLSRN